MQKPDRWLRRDSGPAGGQPRGHDCPWAEPKKCASSSSVSSRDLIRKRTPSGASTENPLPRPFTTSTVRWVCFQYSYCDTDIQNLIGCSSPGTDSSPRSTSASEVMKSPSG